MDPNDNVRRTIQALDNMSNSYGFDANYGLAAADIAMAQGLNPGGRQLPPALLNRVRMAPGAQANIPVQMPAALAPYNSPAMATSYATTNYSVNPAITNLTAGTSTFKVSVSVTQANGGAVGDYFPVFMFGSTAFTNCSRGYTSVNNAGQVTATGFVNGKNVITFTYADPANPTHTTTYTVSLQTEGEYPLALNSLTGLNRYTVRGIQMEVSDATKVAQLQLSLAQFFVNEFGKSQSNDLTTPLDLYQQSSTGVFIPHQFPISDREGAVLNVLNTVFSTTLYYFVSK